MLSPGHRLRRVGAAVVVLACTLVLAGPRPVAALDGLAVTSATTYRLDPEAGVVRARTELGFTNTTVDITENGVVKRRFFTAFTFPVPVGATSPAATTADGTALSVSSQPIEGNTSFFTYSVGFAAPLYAGEHLDVVFTYDIAGLAPRSPDPSRVNPAYVAFTAYGVGDPGQASIRVEVPAAYEIDTIGSDAQVTTADGLTVLTADAIAQPDQYALFVSARADQSLTSTPLTAGDATFDIRGWPGDTDWHGFIGAQLAAGVPQLAELVGRPWPVTTTVTVREAFTPYLYGYAGWFSAADAELEIGEDLDPEVVLHELSHAWFNTSAFDDRWVNEGLAQAYAAAAVATTGGAPTAATAPAADDPARISLMEWGEPDFVQGGDAVETYGYTASYWVIQQIVDHIGIDGMRRVIAAVEDRTIAYPGTGTPEADTTATTDWRRLLDLVDELGPATPGTGWTAQPLFADLVVTTDLMPQLEARTAARAAYATLAARGGTWAPPLAVRRAMADWDFELATAEMTAASGVLDLRDQLAAAGAALGPVPIDDLGAEYTAADHLVAVRQRVQDRLDTVAILQRAEARSTGDVGLLDRIGLVGDDPTGDVAAAHTALANGDDATARAAARRALDAYDGARRDGVQRAVAATAVVVLVMLASSARRRARRRRDWDQAADT
jgi:hypothetical protein